jgi:hypothetical protein
VFIKKITTKDYPFSFSDFSKTAASSGTKRAGMKLLSGISAPLYANNLKKIQVIAK